jgi:hypothetical protein
MAYVAVYPARLHAWILFLAQIDFAPKSLNDAENRPIRRKASRFAQFIYHLNQIDAAKE